MLAGRPALESGGPVAATAAIRIAAAVMAVVVVGNCGLQISDGALRRRSLALTALMIFPLIAPIARQLEPILITELTKNGLVPEAVLAGRSRVMQALSENLSCPRGALGLALETTWASQSSCVAGGDAEALDTPSE